MWRTIINTWKQEFVPKVKNRNTFSIWYPPVYFLLIYPALLIRKASAFTLSIYYTVSLPAFTVLFLTSLFGNTISKTMFLVATDEKDRRRYMISNYQLKILIGMVLNIIGLGISLLLCNGGPFPWLTYATSILAVFEMNIAEGIGPGQKSAAKFGLIVKFIATLLIMLIGFIDNMEVMYHWIYQAIMAANLVYGVIYCIINYPKTLNMADSYETTLKMEKEYQEYNKSAWGGKSA